MFKKKNGAGIRTTGALQSFFIWPLLAGLMMLVLNVTIYFISVPAGTVMSAFVAVYAIILALMWFYYKPSIVRQMVNFAEDYAQVQHRLMEELATPYALLDDSGRIMWMNKAMRQVTGREKDFHKSITTVFKDISREMFPKSDQTCVRHITYNEHDYQIEINKVSIDFSIDKSEILDGEDAALLSMYMFDETQINRYRKQIHDEGFVAGLIYIDNYDEAFEGIEDARCSLFLGLIDKRVNKYFSPGAAIVRKLEKDKYLAVFTYSYLEKLIADKFSILNDIKSINIGNEKTITLSIGIGTGAADYSKNFEIVRAAMDLALGRGGDQTVLKEGDKVTYFGGKSQLAEKNDRVKIRVKAQALMRVMENNDEFFIMGHKLPDIDSFGSAIGIYLMARKMKKNAHIVISEVTATVEPFMARFTSNDDYPEDMFYTGQDALERVSPSTVLIVVDVNRPQITDCPELLNICRTKIVFDHHRQTSDPIADTFMSYVDSSASSASEMVAEMLTYVNEGTKLRGLEADALYAGIVIDTDGFNSKSGPRTFEVAAYLRRNGADVSRVRKLLRNDMNEYKAVAAAVSRAEVYRDSYAISVVEGDGLKSPTIGGAQAANELLDIRGIKASFVITKYEDKIYISARSIDEVNVQLIMEKLGGGGHMTVAGAQFKDKTINNVILELKETIDEMIVNDEL